jgi:hypothetical protein
MAAAVLLAYYAFVSRNFLRSICRCLFFGIMAYVPLDSAHNFQTLATNGVTVFENSSEVSCQPRLMLGGEIAGYIALIMGVVVMSDDERPKVILARTSYTVNILCLGAGILVLALNFDGNTERNYALQMFLFPAVVAVGPVASGVWRCGYDAVVSALFFLGYYSLWILPNIDVVVLNTSEEPSRVRLAGYLCLAAAVISSLPALLAHSMHLADLVRNVFALLFLRIVVCAASQ